MATWGVVGDSKVHQKNLKTETRAVMVHLSYGRPKLTLIKKRNKLFVGTILIKNGTISMKVGTIAVR